MPTLRTRRATAKDLDALVELRDSMFRDMGVGTAEQRRAASDAYRSWAKRMMLKRRLVCFVAETGPDGRVVAGGCVWLRETQPRPEQPRGPAPYLLSMYTAPEFRGRGLATGIVERAMSWARENGYARMTLHASGQGKTVYSKLGWERTWEMARDLKRAPPGPRRKKS